MFLQNLRAKIGARLKGEGEAGFTLIELLVVMLILGILAAIAIPAFFNQRDKGTDAQAKSAVRTAETAMETWATEHGGHYKEGATVPTPATLNAIEPTLQTEGDNNITVDLAEETKYKVTSHSGTGNEFWIERDGGTVKFSCNVKGDGGCPSGEGDWSK
jgi:type IV pilus assembly protein PilA